MELEASNSGQNLGNLAHIALRKWYPTQCMLNPGTPGVLSALRRAVWGHLPGCSKSNAPTRYARRTGPTQACTPASRLRVAMASRRLQGASTYNFDLVMQRALCFFFGGAGGPTATGDGGLAQTCTLGLIMVAHKDHQGA